MTNYLDLLQKYYELHHKFNDVSAQVEGAKAESAYFEAKCKAAAARTIRALLLGGDK